MWCVFTLILSLLVGCGSWVGSPKKPKNDGGGEPVPTSPTGGGNSSNIAAAPGDVLLRKVHLTADKAFSLSSSFKTQASLVDDTSKVDPFEVSIFDANGGELFYSRAVADAIAASLTPADDGDYTVSIKNNSQMVAEILSDSMTGAAFDSGFGNAWSRTTPTSDVLVKAIIGFARNCKSYNSNGSTDTFAAPAGEYYVDPFVFIGKVGADKKVTPIETATVTISSGGRSVTLKKLPDIDVKVYETLSTSNATDQLNYARVFYQGFFGGAGELYTTDYFYYGGNCATATTFALGTDVGATDVELSIDDASQSPALSVKEKVHPTVSTSFSMYTADATKLTDYTQCTYDRSTGEPTTYNGSAGTCKTFSMIDPPYVTLDYKLPSADAASGLTHASDPTRVMYYGNSNPKAWNKALIANADALAAGTLTSVDLDTCFTNGGLTSVPISATKTYLPLGEFNAAADDVIMLGQRTGTFTQLTDYFQGDVDVSGSFSYPTCIPKNGCTFETITVNVKKCQFKADSGIYTMSLNDQFLYPGDFSMSGILAN